MDDLLTICLGSLILSIVTELIYNIIALSMLMQMEKEHHKNSPDKPFFSSNEMIHECYRFNKPEILRRNKFLDAIIILGNKGFFLIFSFSFLILVYYTSYSIFRVLICIPGLLILKFILDLFILFISKAYIKTKYFKS